MTARVAIVGCGLVGAKRARSGADVDVVLCVDVERARAEGLAAEVGAEVSTDWRDAVSRSDVDVVVVATPHDLLSEVAAAAALAGRHVLVEKPAGRSVDEIRRIEAAASASGVKVRVGYNHRFHPALQRSRQLVDSGEIGPLHTVRARYGHGGRPGYGAEWRSRRQISGGGELIDQGTHLIDLARWFLGDLVRVAAATPTYAWDTDVEDNAFVLAETAGGKVAFLHASWTEWKNLFSFEVFGRSGKLEVSGLGGSYGTERLVLHSMLPGVTLPERTEWEYPDPDASFGAELDELVEDIRLDRRPEPGLADALATMAVVEQVYAGGGSAGWSTVRTGSDP